MPLAGKHSVFFKAVTNGQPHSGLPLGRAAGMRETVGWISAAPQRAAAHLARIVGLVAALVAMAACAPQASPSPSMSGQAGTSTSTRQATYFANQVPRRTPTPVVSPERLIGLSDLEKAETVGRAYFSSGAVGRAVQQASADIVPVHDRWLVVFRDLDVPACVGVVSPVGVDSPACRRNPDLAFTDAFVCIDALTWQPGQAGIAVVRVDAADASFCST